MPAVVEAIQQLYPADATETKLFQKVDLGTPPDLSHFIGHEAMEERVAQAWPSVIVGFADPDSCVEEGTEPIFHELRGILQPVVEELQRFFRKCIEVALPGSTLVAFVKNNIIKVGTSHQRWHCDTGLPANVAHSHGFTYNWALRGNRDYEYCDDESISVAHLRPGNMALSSLKLKHHGLATLGTKGALSCHGFVLLRHVPDSCALTGRTHESKLPCAQSERGHACPVSRICAAN